MILWPVPVQGEGASAKIAAAIRTFPSITPKPDLLIVARGGGSIEDLWAFNEEEVVRAAAESPIPLISAVGHETDTTLIDHAADRRAPTPTAAAEMAVPVRAELIGQLGELQHRARHCLSRRFERGRERFDEVGGRLPRSLAARASHARGDLNLVAGRLRRELLDAKVSRLTEQLAGLWRLAELGHPDKPLSRGFARVTSRDGRTLIHARDAREAEWLTLHFGDGNVDATVDGGAAPKPVEPKRRKSYISPQPGLFDGQED